MTMTPQLLLFITFSIIAGYVLIVTYKAIFEIILISLMGIVYKVSSYFDDEMLQIEIWLLSIILFGFAAWIHLHWSRISEYRRRDNR